MASGSSFSTVFLYSVVPLFAVLVTWLTGLPLRWKAGWDCPGPGLGIACFHIGYDWLAFGLDVLFYSAFGYCLLLVYPRFHVGKPAGLRPKET